MIDGIDLSTAILHGTLDPKVARITASFEAVEFATAVNEAVRPVVMPRPLPWPSEIPPGWTGPIQFTLWAFVKIHGVWHGGAMQEFWSDRMWCGANWLLPAPEGPMAGTNNWQANWAYDHGRWGAMCDYVPVAGDEVGFMLLAGDSRPHVRMIAEYPDKTPCIERTNTVRMTLKLAGISTPLDSGTEPPIEPPVEPPVTTPGIEEVLQRLDTLQKTVDTQFAILHDEHVQILEKVQAVIDQPPPVLPPYPPITFPVYVGRESGFTGGAIRLEPVV
jgi:hypothetical protein